MTNIAADTRRDVAALFAGAGVCKPEATAAAVLPSLVRNDSIFTLSASGGTPSSTVSTRLRGARWRDAIRVFNHQARRRTRERLREFPPDNDQVLLVLDPSEQEYWKTRAANKRIPVENSRQTFALLSTADNKKAPHCHKHLVAILMWHHHGQVIIQPILSRLLGPLDQQPLDHARWILAALQTMGVKPGISIGDMGYDSPHFRSFMADEGHSFMHRVNMQAGDSRKFVLADGRQVRIRDLMDEVVHTKLPIQPGQLPSGRRYAYKVQNFRGHFPSDGTAITLTLRVGVVLKGGSRKLPTWQRDPETCMVVASNLNAHPETLSDLYFLRHQVEVLFEHFSTDRSGARPKTIQAHILQFLSKLTVIAAAIALRVARRLNAQNPDSKHLTVKNLARSITENSGRITDPIAKPG